MAARDIISGDIVEHTNSHRRGCVVEVGRTHHDGTIEYRVRPSQDDRFDVELTWWNSAHICRVMWGDPFRRYLATVVIEDNLAKQERRQQPPEGRCSWARRDRMFGPWLPETVWEKLYWRLSNQLRHDPNGACVYYDLGRAAWEKAAIECLERRDRAARWWQSKKTALIMFKFSSDDDQFRTRLFQAILDDQCPDFERSLGSPSGTGRSYTALWRPEHAGAVRAWARSIGVEPVVILPDLHVTGGATGLRGSEIKGPVCVARITVSGLGSVGIDLDDD